MERAGLTTILFRRPGSAECGQDLNSGRQSAEVAHGRRHTNSDSADWGLIGQLVQAMGEGRELT